MNFPEFLWTKAQGVLVTLGLWISSKVLAIAANFGPVAEFITDEGNLRVVDGLVKFGALGTLLLTWIYWLVRIPKKSEK